MIAVDSNILVYAHRPEFEFHEEAHELMRSLCEGPTPWGLVLHCLVEFTGVVTDRRRFRNPSTMKQALAQVSAWRSSPSAHLLGDGPAVLDAFEVVAGRAKVHGARVHDARIAATCVAHGVQELLSCDRDYGRFPQLRVRNPFIE